MPQKTEWVTIGSRNYWAHLCVAAQSIIRHHPDSKISVVLIDGNGEIDLLKFPGEIYLLEEIGIKGLEHFRIKYGVSELATAIRPWVHQYFFNLNDLKRIIYFDLDLWFKSSIESVIQDCSGHPIAFCPTTLSEYPLDGCYPDARSYRLSGLYNAGFMILERCEETEAFLRWWQEWLTNHCRFDTNNGFFGDQRFLDVVPLFFPKTKMIRDIGCNVAYWNIHERNLKIHENQYLVDSVPLRFFHFSGFNVKVSNRLSKTNDNRDYLKEGNAIDTLKKGYYRELLNFDLEKYERIPYQYSTLSNGTQIQVAFRYYCLDHPEILEGISDPFSSSEIRRKHLKFKILTKMKRLIDVQISKIWNYLLKCL